MCWGLTPEGVTTCGIGVGGGGEAWEGVSDMATSLDTAGVGGLVGAALGFGEEASTLLRILSRRSCYWRDLWAKLTSWPESSSTLRSRSSMVWRWVSL